MKQRRASISMVAFVCFWGGVVVAYAQGWINPESLPPINNDTQLVLENTFENYIHRGTSTEQWVSGQTIVGAGGSYEVTLGIVDGSVNTGAVSVGFGIVDTTDYLDGSIGMYAYDPNVSHTVFGYSASSNIASYGIVGRGLAGALAGRFWGPVVVNDNSTSGVLGDVSVSGTIESDQGLICDDTANCTPLSGTAAWLAAEHQGNGTALYGLGANGAGVRIAIDDSASLGGAAAQAYAVSGYGATGYGAVGAYGIISSAHATAPQYGVAGIATNNSAGSFSRIGILGESQGGFGSGNYGDDNTPQYDLASGVRACAKDATGALARLRGLNASGGAYAGYFDTEFGADMLIVSVCANDSFEQCDRDQDCGSGSCVGVLKIGSVYLTKTNLRGLLCKASGAINLASCTL